MINHAMGRKIGISLAVIATLMVARNLKYAFAYLVFGLDGWAALDPYNASTMVAYGQITLVMLVTALLMGRSTFSALMMDRKALWGIGFGLVLSLPMWLGYGIMAGGELNMNLPLIHRDILSAGIGEELLYRSFLFGILFYQARWGFVPAALLPGIFFGIGHLYQAEDLGSSIGIFLFTSLGSVGFSWFLHVTKNFWLLASLHAFMDLAWDLFSIQTDVTGNLWVNVFRFISLGAMIFYCVKQYRKDPDLNLNGRLWINPE